MTRDFAGTSEFGDLREALGRAIADAKTALTTDMVEWTSVRICGVHGGFVLRDDLTVVISAKVPRDTSTEARFEMADASEPGRPFVVKIAGAEKIAHARRILSGEETARVHVQGTIVKQPASFNPGWSFHIDSCSVDFFEFAVEVCDATMVFVEDHLEEVGGATLPNRHWCPWSSRLLREVT